VPSATRALQSLPEEIANSLTHGLGLGLAVAAIPILVEHARGAGAVTGAALFGSTALLTYLVSTLYHALREGRAKLVLRWLDHAAIYGFIAGSYTPFTLTVLRGAWGWSLFGLVWGLAVLGILFKTLGTERFPRLSTLLYLAMGWVALVAIRPLWLAMPASAMVWLVGGGVAYSLGVVFFLLDQRLRYAHSVWHLFVLAGSVCHFFAVLQVLDLPALPR
jgi:hemolysin III